MNKLYIVNEFINISFFKQPRICSNSKHKIDFNDKIDKYNPFSNINYIYKLSISLNKDILLNIENLSYAWFVETQLNECQNENERSYVSLRRASFNLNDAVLSAFINYFNSFLEKKAVDLKKCLKKHSNMPYIFCMIYASFADIGVQIFLSKFKESFVVSCAYIIYINFHDSMVKFSHTYDIFNMNM